MKTICNTTALTVTAALISLGGAHKGFAADSDSAPTNNPPPAAQTGTMNNDDTDAPDEKTYEGNITAVNKDANTFSVKGYLFSKTFNAAKPCKISLQDSNGATNFAALQPGQDVEVRYENYDGVLIAHEVDQHDMTRTGHITSMDLNTHKLTIKHGFISHSFVLSPECDLTLQGARAGTLNNLQVGDAVTVTYQSVKGDNVAKRIEAKGAEFTGVIQSIDSSDKVIEAKDVDGNGPDRKFNMADNCSIVINGKTDGTLSDLKPGERVAFNYESENGVLVATRIGLAPDQATGVATPTANNGPATPTAGNVTRVDDR